MSDANALEASWRHAWDICENTLEASNSRVRALEAALDDVLYSIRVNATPEHSLLDCPAYINAWNILNYAKRNL